MRQPPHRPRPKPHLPLAASVLLLFAVTAHAEPPRPASTGVRAAGRASAAQTSRFRVDPAGFRSPDAVETSTRATLRFEADSGDSWGPLRLQGRVSGDFGAGVADGVPQAAGDKLPGSRKAASVPLESWAEASVAGIAGLRSGLMVAQWGLGLVANDGMHAFDARNGDWFVQAETGDRVLRTALWTSPWRNTDSPLRGVLASFAVDKVVDDDVARAVSGDSANQLVGALRMHFSKEQWAGVYWVYRDQQTETGKFLTANVVDLTADFDLRTDGKGLHLQAEGALIRGRTSLAPQPDHPEHDVKQAAFVARGRYDFGSAANPDRPSVRLEADIGWLSGDANMDDVALTAFKADVNFQQGLVLFPRVLGWQTGRARLTASNPRVLGQAPQDLDRLATAGAVTSAITVFPKVGWMPCSGFELYGGTLFAFAPSPPLDPYHTRIAGGGEPRTLLGKAPGGVLLGMEFDVGVRIGHDLALGRIEVGAEGGLLVPGGALADLGDDGPIHAGRVTLQYVPWRKP
ncbi:MAG: hypothetical protein EXR79_11600 [Myxococcales bacterium]|nr:hypothetical protein [Myxococcales bacterium]